MENCSNHGSRLIYVGAYDCIQLQMIFLNMVKTRWYVPQSQAPTPVFPIEKHTNVPLHFHWLETHLLSLLAAANRALLGFASMFSIREAIDRSSQFYTSELTEIRRKQC